MLDEAHHLEDVAASPPRRPGRAAGRCGGCSPASSGTAAGWRRPSPTSCRARGDLLSRASLDLLQQRLLPGARRRPPSQRGAVPAAVATGWTVSRPASSAWRDDFATDDDLGRGPRLRARCDAGRLPRAAGDGGDDRRPAGRSGGNRAAGRSCCRSSEAVMRRLDGDLRRPQPDAPSGRRRPADGAVDGADARAGQQRQPLGRAARPGAGPADAAVRPARYGRAHQRDARRRRRLRLPRDRGSGWRARTRRSRCARCFPRRSTTRRSACSASRTTCPEPREDEHAPRDGRGAGRHRSGLRVRRRDVRAVHQPRLAPAGRAGAARGAGRPGGPSWCRAKRRGTCCCAVSAQAENAILLGTDSFWEGVDVPGRALRTLVLNKLPFKVPTRAAHGGAARAAGGRGAGRVHELPAAPRGAQAQAGVRAADPEPAGHGGRGPARQPGRHQAVRAAAAGRPAAGGADHRQLGAGADQVRGLLRPAGHRGDRRDPGAPVEDRLRRPELRGARQGAGERGAAGADAVLQAAQRPHRPRRADRAARRPRDRWSTRPRSAW